MPLALLPRTEANMFSIQNLKAVALVGACVMAGVGLGAAALPLEAQNQEMLCMFYFPGCTKEDCQTIYCDVYYFGSEGFCQGAGGVCCNCYY